jgi:hypothetical protein
VFEIRVLRKIFGSIIEEVTGDWRKLCNEEHRGFQSLSDIILVSSLREVR